MHYSFICIQEYPAYNLFSTKGGEERMKSLISFVLLLCLTASLALAQEKAATATAVTLTLKGTIIDNLCADANKADLANFTKTHPKSCALMPTCAASGYSIFADGKLYKFDKDSSKKIEEFLKKEDSKLQVVVQAKQTQEELSLISIANQ